MGSCLEKSRAGACANADAVAAPPSAAARNARRSRFEFEFVMTAMYTALIDLRPDNCSGGLLIRLRAVALALRGSCERIGIKQYSPPCITARRGGRAIKRISRSIL